MRELPAAAPRAVLHTRQITCAGYEREDGLWDIEGRLSDVRSWPLDGLQGTHPRAAGDPLHLMSLRLTLDSSFLIVAAQAVTHQAPYDECPDINPAYQQLVGLRIEGGFGQAVKALLRGASGCTHLTDLIGPMATTAVQTIRPMLMRRKLAAGVELTLRDQAPVNSCHALREQGKAHQFRVRLIPVKPDGTA